MKVLVVDDDAAGLEIRRLVLERRGFAVHVAATAQDARRSFAETPPDTVILDLRLPEIEDGLALIREFQSARIVVVCGNGGDLDGRPEAAMVRAILTKPVRSDELIRHLGGESS